MSTLSRYLSLILFAFAPATAHAQIWSDPCKEHGGLPLAGTSTTQAINMVVCRDGTFQPLVNGSITGLGTGTIGTLNSRHSVTVWAEEFPEPHTLTLMKPSSCKMVILADDKDKTVYGCRKELGK